MLRVLDLFSGIGGFSLGLERAGGFETVAFCEIDPYAQRVLRKQWPEVPIYEDVRTLTAERLAADGVAVDVLTGGFPCQDLSVAGKRAGIDGERSGLWSEIVRLAGDLRPRFIVCENVRNLLSGGGSAEIPTDRCLCGWPYRWRRVSLGSKKETMVRGALRHWNVCKGAASNAGASRTVRRKSDQAAGRYGEMGGRLEVGSVRQEVLGGAPGCDAISAIKAAPGGIAFEDGSCSWRDGQGACFRVEPEGAERANNGSGLVCPACGRSVVNAASRHVYSTWFGRVLGDLARLGYDAEWENIPAAAVGAPHRRERVWIVAYPERGQQPREKSLCGSAFGMGREFESVPWDRTPERALREFRRVDDGLSYRVDRTDGIRNAIVPQIPEMIGRAILEADNAA